MNSIGLSGEAEDEADGNCARRAASVFPIGSPPETTDACDPLDGASSPRSAGRSDHAFFRATDSTMLATSSHRSVAVSIVS